MVFNRISTGKLSLRFYRTITVNISAVKYPIAFVCFLDAFSLSEKNKFSCIHLQDCNSPLLYTFGFTFANGAN
jgi:hypothetical protein